VTAESELEAPPEPAQAVSEPEAWEAAADETARALGLLIDDLAASLQAGSRAPGRSFWEKLRELQDGVRTAPAIKLDDKLALQARLRGLSEQARRERKAARQAAAALKSALQDRIVLASEAVDVATSAQELHEIRSELRVLRERVESEGRSLDRAGREAVWQAWQSVNQAAWDALNRVWESNEASLRAILDEAGRQVAAGQPAAARERVKAFHAEAAALECSHRSIRELRAAAGELWQRADELGRQKHAAYLQFASRRLDHWRGQQARLERSRRGFEEDLDQLARTLAAATTDVAAALVRGQIEQTRKALLEIDREQRDLSRRIESAESALSRS
jgi:hypothetical protein